MANKEKVAVSNSKSYRKPLYSGSLGTAGFFQLYPVFYQHLTRFDSIDAGSNFFARLNPLVKPTFSVGNYHFVNFFVRYKDVFPRWDQFTEETKESFPGNILPSRVISSPYILFSDFFEMFLNSAEFVINGSERDYDFIYVTVATERYYKFTSVGAQAYKLLTSLGYEFSWRFDDNRHMNLLPLFCIGKIYLDYYYPRAYLNLTQHTQRISAAFSVQWPTNRALPNDVLGSPGRIYADAITSILTICTYTFFENNKFYSAWDTPMGPSLDNGININYEDPTIDGDGVVISDPNTYDGTPHLSTNHTITQTGIQLLERITNLVKRYQASGNSIINRVLARYGRKLTDDHRAMKLNHCVVPIKVGDVESNSFAENGQGIGNLGDLAGKSVGIGGFKLRCKSGSHAGMFVTMCSIVPEAELFQGIDKFNLASDPYSFYTPEFDRVLTAIAKSEVYNDMDGANNDDVNGVFGFNSMYYQYIRDRKVLVGDFRLLTHGAEELQAYHTFRALYPEVGGLQSEVVHDLDFLKTSNTIAYFNRIFYNRKLQDQFIIDFTVKGSTYGPKAPINDQYDWGDDEDNKKVFVNGQNSDLN